MDIKADMFDFAVSGIAKLVCFICRLNNRMILVLCIGKSKLTDTQLRELFGYSIPASNKLKHKTLSNGLIGFLVGISW